MNLISHQSGEVPYNVAHDSGLLVQSLQLRDLRKVGTCPSTGLWTPVLKSPTRA